MDVYLEQVKRCQISVPYKPSGKSNNKESNQRSILAVLFNHSFVFSKTTCRYVSSFKWKLLIQSVQPSALQKHIRIMSFSCSNQDSVSAYELGTAGIFEQRRLGRVCASAQTRQCQRCSHTQSMGVEEDPCQLLDSLPR